MRQKITCMNQTQWIIAVQLLMSIKLSLWETARMIVLPSLRWVWLHRGVIESCMTHHKCPLLTLRFSPPTSDGDAINQHFADKKPHLVFLAHVSVLQLKLLSFKLAHPLPEFICGVSAWKPTWREHEEPVHECEATACGSMSRCMLKILHFMRYLTLCFVNFLPQLIRTDVFDVQLLAPFTQDRFFLLSLGLLLRPAPFVCLSIKLPDRQLALVTCAMWPLTSGRLYPLHVSGVLKAGENLFLLSVIVSLPLGLFLLFSRFFFLEETEMKY